MYGISVLLKYFYQLWPTCLNLNSPNYILNLIKINKYNRSCSLIKETVEVGSGSMIKNFNVINDCIDKRLCFNLMIKRQWDVNNNKAKYLAKEILKFKLRSLAWSMSKFVNKKLILDIYK